MTFHVITLFPEGFESYFKTSIIGRAIKEKKISVKFYNPRDFVRISKSQKNKKMPYMRVDDRPFGGGPGMILQAEPVIRAIEKAKKAAKTKPKIILLSRSGREFNNKLADRLSHFHRDLILISGRYEGIDARVKKIFKAEEISVGPYVVTGGELPVMIIIDAVSRRIPGVLGNIESLEENRASSSEIYTRPEVLEYKGKKYRVPQVLLSGHHKKIEEWKKKSTNH